MGNGQDMGKQVLEQAKKAAKEAAKKVKKAILNAIKPALPYIAAGVGILVLIILVVCLFTNFSEMGITANAAETEATGWWWPIGSAETTTEGGKKFASGTPVDSIITSGVGPRWGRSHNGLDIASAGSAPGPYIIASRDGTVEYAIDGFEDNGSLGNNDGGGFGNHVIIDYGDGIKVTYGHLSKNTIEVKAGDTVTYGQVIAKMGHSGQSTGMHLHFEMRLNGTVVDPEEYISQDDPRPVTTVDYSTVGGVSALSEFLASWENDAMRQYKNGTITDYNSSEYIYMCITKDKKYYIMHDDIGTGYGNRNYGFGICFYVGRSGSFQNTSYFKEEGIDVTSAEYNSYGKSKISVEIVDRIKEKIITECREDAKAIAKNAGVSLTDYQIDAIAACIYQGWESTPEFLAAYKKYGMNESIRSQCSGMNRNCEPADRGDANWILFSTGKYTGRDGKEIKFASKGTIADASGSGYTKSVTVGKRKYLVYNQGAFPGNIGPAGCSITSEAIVLSGYGKSKTPKNIADDISWSFPRSLSQIASDLTNYGVKSTASVKYNQHNNSSTHKTAISEIKSNLSNGRPVIILVRSGPDARYTGSAHYMVLVGFNEKGYPIIADPNGGRCRTESTLEDLVKKYIYAYSESGSEQGYVLIKQ